MQLGFIIDHTRCIGCHACTVACKSENHVPVGNYRTWVKYTESGTFPSVRRGFSVLRCNQCTHAPCVTICPVTALDKREDGIVDVNPELCIGCKACTHACPYDAIYINEATGTAEKCHFCAHRTDRGLAPACAVVCPTEAIIPGDFHDPGSRVSEIGLETEFSVRKPEAGTGPNVRYVGVDSAGIQPGETNLSNGFIWSQPPTGERVEAQAWEYAQSAQGAEGARTTYDVPRSQIWGWKVGAYLWTKSIAAGVFPIATLGALLAPTALHEEKSFTTLIAGIVSLIFLGLTSVLLIADLKRPERFLSIFRKPNWNSWLVRGSFILAAYEVLLVVDIAYGLIAESGTAHPVLLWITALLGAATAAYTAFLFGQAKGRVLWMRRGMAVHLVFQAGIGGSAFLFLMDAVGIVLDPGMLVHLPWILGVCLGGHLGFALIESRCAPNGREKEYERASALLTRGPYARRHWGLGVVLGILLPVVILAGIGLPLYIAALLSLIGLLVEEDLLVRAGQALPIS